MVVVNYVYYGVMAVWALIGLYILSLCRTPRLRPKQMWFQRHLSNLRWRTQALKRFNHWRKYSGTVETKTPTDPPNRPYDEEKFYLKRVPAEEDEFVKVDTIYPLPPLHGPRRKRRGRFMSSATGFMPERVVPQPPLVYMRRHPTRKRTFRYPVI